jgi:hypothetical protein
LSPAGPSHKRVARSQHQQRQPSSNVSDCLSISDDLQRFSCHRVCLSVSVSAACVSCHRQRFSKSLNVSHRVCLSVSLSGLSVSLSGLSVCLYVCMYVCMYICMSVYVGRRARCLCSSISRSVCLSSAGLLRLLTMAGTVTRARQPLALIEDSLSACRPCQSALERPVPVDSYTLQFHTHFEFELKARERVQSTAGHTTAVAQPRSFFTRG